MLGLLCPVLVMDTISCPFKALLEWPVLRNPNFQIVGFSIFTHGDLPLTVVQGARQQPFTCCRKPMLAFQTLWVPETAEQVGQSVPGWQDVSCRQVEETEFPAEGRPSPWCCE